MIASLRRYPVFCLGAALVALVACRTEEVDAPWPPITPPGDNNGGLLISFAPSADTFDGQLARATNGEVDLTQIPVFLDGHELVDALGQSYGVFENSTVSFGYFPAGTYHLTIGKPGDSSVFAGDVAIPPRSANRLFLFAYQGAIQSHFFSYPATPAPDTLHVAVLNLVRAGPAIEVVRCTDATTCAPVSAPLAIGESFEAVFPAAPVDFGSPGPFLLADGSWLGYRQAASATLPAPPVLNLMPGDQYPASWTEGVDPQTGRVKPILNLLAVPIYMSPEGNVVQSFD